MIDNVKAGLNTNFECIFNYVSSLYTYEFIMTTSVLYDIIKEYR